MLTVLTLVAVLAYRLASPIFDNKLVGLMSAAMAVIPVLILMRCNLDRC